MGEMPEKPREACGVFGIYSRNANVARLAYFGLFALQHRGQESAGIVTYEDTPAGTETHSHQELGLVSQVFSEQTIQGLRGHIAIGHNRYSTTGSNLSCNTQPVLAETSRGTISLAHNGNLVNADQLREELVAAGRPLLGTTDSEEMAQVMAEAVEAGKSWIESAIIAARRSVGAFSLVIGTPEGIIGLRDSHGVRPLVLGFLDGQYVLASETCALDIISAEYLREVEPGEIVWIDGEGLHSERWATAQSKLCIFEMIYFARPDSQFHGESLYSYRVRLGEVLARESAVPADEVIGVPDSGIPAAIGFARAVNLPYTHGLVKNRYVARTFIQPTQKMREQGIKMKLNPLPDVLRNKRVILVDDSIVRGTTSKRIVKALREAGAAEIHMRICSPPVTHPCFYGIDTDNQNQLIAAKQSVAQIQAHLEVDSLYYLSWEGMMEATGKTGNEFCSACFTGKYPISIPTGVQRSKLILESMG